MTINVETENAGTYPDVDETQLLALSDRLADGMAFLIVHDPARNMEYAQAAPSIDGKGTYVVEYHDGANYHHQATVDTTADVGRFLSGWAWQREGWRDGYQWTEIEELRGVNQPL